jgi:hypothetical protein
LRRRDGISQRIVAYFYTTCLAVQIAAILLLQLLHSVFHVHDTVVYIGFLINLITVVIFIYEYRSSAFTQTINNYLITTIDKFIDNNDTCNLRHGDYLIVRFSGDEAGIGLSVAQSASYAISRASEHLYKVLVRSVSIISNSWFFGREFPELMLLVLLSTWLGLSQFIVTYDLNIDQIRRLVANDQYKDRSKLELELSDAKRELDILKKNNADLFHPQSLSANITFECIAFAA